MGAYPNDRSNDPMGPITYGRDFNFFANVTPTVAIGSSFNFDADICITFPSYTVTFTVASGGGVAQYSFNGNTVHGDIGGPSGGVAGVYSLVFQNRQISKVWFRGTGPIRVEAWGIR
jgi:hypothetical protein